MFSSATYEKLGVFYIGKKVEESKDAPLLLNSSQLTTHAVILGMTGSGKTGLGIDILEDAAIDKIPALIIDPKGDMGNLLLTFPHLSKEEFLPWIDPQEAERANLTPEQFAEKTAKKWKDGLASWGEDSSRIANLKSSVEYAIYTPANSSGRPISILSSFSAPSPDLIKDEAALRDRVMTASSGLLTLVGINADPLKSREHILLSRILEDAWKSGKNLSLPDIINAIQKPSFDKVGVMDVDTFYPAKDRLELSMTLNNLLAAPGFSAWMEGEPLDIQRLLYTDEGKPRHSILSIAHLQDNERMFFVTLLLNEIVTWLRRQPGTTSLRALLYMDEIFGYFPPSSMPPSKMPMLTLLKQARAYGFGVILATQNPVDLDYKGLANCGLWFIGKLQTDRDRSRVIEGLQSGTNSTLAEKLKKCGSRIFLLHSIYEQEPILFETRWTLSYLRGPLTLPQIASLTPQIDKITAAVNQIPQAPSAPARTQKPIVIQDYEEYFVAKKNARGDVEYMPLLIGIAKIHYTSSKNNIDQWSNISLVAPFSADNREVDWGKGESMPDIFSLVSKEQPQDASFREIPSILKNFKDIQKDFQQYLYEFKTLDLLSYPELKMNASSDQTEGDFRAAVALKLREQRDVEVTSIREKYRAKIDTLKDKIDKAQTKVDKQQTQSWQNIFSSIISFLSTLLGAFMGRGMTKGTLNQAGTAMRRAGKIGQSREEVTYAEGSLEKLKQQQQELEDSMQTELSAIQQNVDPTALDIKKIPIAPKKSDISVQTIALVWWPAK
ncbi:MAG: DUF87 domain-containing protein [Parachlamydiales bacterium]|jgi:hypothetical protein